MIAFISLVLLIAFVGMIVKINFFDETDSDEIARRMEMYQNPLRKTMADDSKKVRSAIDAAYASRKQRINEKDKFNKILSMDSKAAKGFFTNSIGMKFNFIPSGEFMMGSHYLEKHREYGERQNKVRLTHGFYIGIHQVTQAQYQAVMGGNPSRFVANNNPVEQVSWEDATNFCKKLSAKEGIEYALPTEAQWEYACRAGTTTAYYWGNQWQKGICNAENDEGSNEEGNCEIFRERGITVAGTTPVGSFKPSAYGLYDIIGNVWEWCHDSYHSDCYNWDDGRGERVDPFGWSMEEERYVLRGASWSDSLSACRSASRYTYYPESEYIYDIGFRVVIPVCKTAEISTPDSYNGHKKKGIEVAKRVKTNYFCELPKYLDKKIFEESRGKYEQKPDEVTDGLKFGDKEINNYLGTYFPRTYIETANIFSELFENDPVRKAFQKKTELKILDIGSGPGGGSFLGILKFIAHQKLSECKKIIVYSIDGNQNALNSQEELLNAFRLENPSLSVELNQTWKKFSFGEKDFKTELVQILKDINQAYDIIITSKFLSELYINNGSQVTNLYYHFACITSKYLSPQGLLAISDVTILRQKEFQPNFPLEGSMPVIMKNELHKFVKEPNQMSYILPLSCGLWHGICKDYSKCFTQWKFTVSHSEIQNKQNDTSKISYNVFSHKEIAEEVFRSIKKKDKYFNNAAIPDEACCKGSLSRGNIRPPGELDEIIF